MKVLPVPVGQGKQDALLVRRYGFQHIVDGDVLVVTRAPGAALVLEGDGGEAFAPLVVLGEGQLP